MTTFQFYCKFWINYSYENELYFELIKDKRYNEILYWASSYNLIHIVKLMLNFNKENLYNYREYDYKLIIDYAVKNNYIEIVKLILLKKKKYFYHDGMMWASIKNNIKIVKLLFEYNIKNKISNIDYITAIGWAKVGNFSEIVKILEQ